jgi:hypothetical protein
MVRNQSASSQQQGRAQTTAPSIRLAAGLNDHRETTSASSRSAIFSPERAARKGDRDYSRPLVSMIALMLPSVRSRAAASASGTCSSGYSLPRQ